MKSELSKKLKDREFRHAYVAARIKKDVALQIRILRTKKNWSQKQLAEAVKMAQARISLMENPNYGKFNTETLKRLAKTFDVALIVRFAPFSELTDWSERLSEETFNVASFSEEYAVTVNGPKEHSTSIEGIKITQMGIPTIAGTEQTAGEYKVMKSAFNMYAGLKMDTSSIGHSVLVSPANLEVTL